MILSINYLLLLLLDPKLIINWANKWSNVTSDQELSLHHFILDCFIVVETIMCSQDD